MKTQSQKWHLEAMHMDEKTPPSQLLQLKEHLVKPHPPMNMISIVPTIKRVTLPQEHLLGHREETHHKVAIPIPPLLSEKPTA